MAQLAARGEGIIALTGCLASRFCQRLVDGRDDEARAHVDDLMNAFGADNVYFEVQKNGIADQEKANEGIVRIAREVGRPIVGTGDVHYLRREDYHHHTALLCVQTKSTLAAPKMTFDTNEFFLRSSEEMVEAFDEWPEAIASTLEIAERCDVNIELGRQLIPRYLPEGEDERAHLRERVMEGLRARYGDPIPAAAVERAEMELAVIDRMGFNAYFLIVWDFVKWAKDNGIAVGPGRGSAAGSIVAYALRITDLDPLRYDLLFERFLNPERVSMPDIDIDFSVRGRERVMQYVVAKYGRESVAQIITFGKMFPRAATRDAARVLGHDYGVGDRLAKLIPDPEQGRAPSFDRCLQPGEPLRGAYDTDATSKQIIDVARGLEGIVRNASIHAAAVVIAGMPLTDVVPLQLADSGGGGNGNGNGNGGEKDYRLVTQFSMKPVEELGLLKMDFLGLRNLDVIEDALDIIERSSGQRPDMTSLPLDDAKTYEMMARGDSVGVFQFESEGMQSALRQVKTSEFDDLVALNALYRPGAMDQIPTYARGKRNPDAVTVPDERLAPIIGSTYGVILYQEQAMQISKTLAGFFGREGRRPAQGDRQEEPPGDGGAEARVRRGLPHQRRPRRASSTGCGTTNEKSADYSFNKSHAACYALIAYRTAWLKANYPAEYMAALISSVMDTKDKVPFFAAKAEEHGDRHPATRREPLRPRVRGRRRQHPVRTRRGQGRGLRGRRGDQGGARGGWGVRVDLGLLRPRRPARGQQARDRGADQVRRLRLDRRLAQGHARRARAGAGARASRPARRADRPGVDLRPRRLGAATAGAAAAFAAPQHPPIPREEFEQAELLAIEKEAIGLFISAHPLKEVREALRAAVDAPLSSLPDHSDGDWVTAGGIITPGQEDPHEEGRPDDVRHPRRPRGRHRGPHLRQGARRVRGRRSGSTRSCSCADASTTGTRAASLIAQTVEPFRPTPEEVEAAREAAAAGPRARSR